MRDYDRERDKPSVSRVYTAEDGTTVSSRGPLKPYNALLEALGSVIRSLVDKGDYDALRRLAWQLGTEGEYHACEVILRELNRPRYSSQMYGEW